MNTFAQAFFEDNAGDEEVCPFRDWDSIHLIAFAMLMLNTDLHKSGQPSSRKSSKKMTKTEFIQNTSLAVHGNTVSKEFLSRIYDSIEAKPFSFNDDTSRSQYDSREQTIYDMISSVSATDSLLRGVAVHDFQFVSIDDYSAQLGCHRNDALSDVTRNCVSKTWHHWHGVVSTCMEASDLDPQGMEHCVEIILYALCATICLNMPLERSAFLNQLVRLKAFEERRKGTWVSSSSNNRHREESWFLELEDACGGTVEMKLWAMRTIHKWIKSLQAAFHGDVPSKVGMVSAVSEIRNGSFLLQDPSRSYVRSGNLVKKSVRNGKTTEYRFYLFSDILLYASKEQDGYYKIHDELPLHLMKIVDWFPPSSQSHLGKQHKVMFEVHHPRKTFQVICQSTDERRSWVDDIRKTLAQEIDRKMKLESARIAFHTSREFSRSNNKNNENTQPTKTTT